MNKTCKRLMTVLLFFALMISVLPTRAFANSAEPPSLIILVNNPPKDLSIVLVSDQTQPQAQVRRVAWEGYYVFYSRDMRSGGTYTFKVTANTESFECTLDELEGYNNVFTLNLTDRELTPGEYPMRSVLLISIRLVLTLLLEGIVFLLFGFKQKRSWLVFLLVNLVTQGLLNIWLNGASSLLSSYLILALIAGELFVFIAEMIAFPLLIKEHKKGRCILYAFVANLLSLIAGGYIITVLPV